VKRFRLDWNAGVAALCLGAAIAATVIYMPRDEPTKGPEGKVTQKMWVQEFWQAGEQLYPARWCLELNYRDEVCIPESNWNQYSIGDWYK
jgi:hypothetical protein